MSEQSRPATPKPVARELRQLAGFGCCRCGLPILQYHHIIPYSIEEHFRVKDMMALCPICHDMATKKALTIEKQRELQASPFNIRKRYVNGSLQINSLACVIKTGGVMIVGQGPLITVDNHPLLSLTLSEDGQLELSVNLYDKKDRLVAVIEKNEWVSGDVQLWDIRADYQKLTLNKKSGQIEIEINTQNDEINIKARLWYKKQFIRLGSMGLSFNNNSIVIQDLGFVNAMFTMDSKTNSASITSNDGKGMVIVSEVDHDIRISKALEIWKTNYKNAETT